MNKKQLMSMWVGILLVSLVWLGGSVGGTKELVLIVIVITAGLVVSLSDRNYKLTKEIVESLKRVKEYLAVVPAWLVYLFKSRKCAAAKDKVEAGETNEDAKEEQASGILGRIRKLGIRGLWEKMDRRIKKFGILDEKLAQAAAIFFALIIVKWIPQIMDINIWWFVVLLIVCAIKPLYVFYIKK